MSTFVVVKPSRCGSEFHAAGPSGAARKAYSKCLRHRLKKSDRKKSHVIKVAHKGKDKVFSYKVKEVNDPRVVERDGVEIKYRFSTKVKSMQKKNRKSRGKKGHSRSRK